MTESSERKLKKNFKCSSSETNSLRQSSQSQILHSGCTLNMRNNNSKH